MSRSDLLYRLFIFWYVCGLILVGMNWLPSWLEWANGVFLILAGLLGGIFFVHQFGWKKGLVITSVISLTSLAVEYAGARYGFWFGHYDYTEKFAPLIAGVPIAIGFAWLMVIATSHALARIIFPDSNWKRVMTGALIALSYDLIIDPVAFHSKQYWIWEGPGIYYQIPLSNFLGWFLLAFIFHGVVEAIGAQTLKSSADRLWERRMVYVYSMVIVMFLFLGILAELWLATAVTAILAVTVLFLAGKKGGLS